jgi:CRP/FNR family transcriptional regulator
MSGRAAAVKHRLVGDTRMTPVLRGIPFMKSVTEETIRLTDQQREMLISIALRLQLPARSVLYRDGTEAEFVYIVNEGLVRSFRHLANGKRVVCAFLYPRDLFGLAENGRYVNCTETVTRSTLYRLSMRQLATLLKQDGHLQFHFLTKVTHELRESQKRAVVIGRRDAAGRLAMFIAMVGERTDLRSIRDCTVPLPMLRSDIADYLGLSLESVSRAARELEQRGLVRFEGRRAVRILQPERFGRLVTAV